jgi:hypothetical protein
MLGGLLSFQQPITVTGQGLDLGQQRRRDRQNPPAGVFVAQSVSEHERIETVVLDGGDLITLPGAC